MTGQPSPVCPFPSSIAGLVLQSAADHINVTLPVLFLWFCHRRKRQGISVQLSSGQKLYLLALLSRSIEPPSRVSCCRHQARGLMRQVGIATFAALRGVSRGLVAAECRTAGCNNLSSDCSNLSSTCAEIHEPYRALSIAMDTTCRRFGGSGAWAPPNTPEPAARRTAPQTTGPQASAALSMSLRQFATQQQTPGKRESLRNRCPYPGDVHCAHG